MVKTQWTIALFPGHNVGAGGEDSLVMDCLHMGKRIGYSKE